MFFKIEFTLDFITFLRGSFANPHQEHIDNQKLHPSKTSQSPYIV
ncbi:hypothetical protein HHE02_04600 [Helicobacter heilmannii]|nr:hypothetical protein HHE014_12330 [Helicobacter heilmannii]CRF47173.1 hypothetical protein HHE02_04600 [Helicobacter heilmannii]CRF50228.1 hypothetical protein HHE06_00480 [Helicobacter heilmannii]